MKTLIVDDEPLFLDLMEHTLQALGYTDVFRATSAQGALDMVESAKVPFQCFLLDIQMPEMDGIELCAALRAKSGYKHTPILMVTAMTEKRFVDWAFQAGANDYVTKPIEALEIKARMGMVERLLLERTQSGQLQTQLKETEAAFGQQIDFDEPFVLPDVPWVLPFSSLENYVLRLGNMRMVASVAVGFHVINGPELYAGSSGVEFVDGMSEVAVSISEVLPLSPRFLSYAGSGDFCAVIPRLTAIDPRLMALRINDTLEQRATDIFGTGKRPRIRVGKPQSNGLISFKDPSSVLFRAIDDARHNVTTKKLKLRGYEHNHA